ncbi:MAG: 7-cyano-7-deazaguanine/7-aminomethyl-7-deazaguanine transporter [Francisellaceae bacterium]|jgi:queuosine precursor transporter|nr:7-cyano-7-deazaguanine/7-aminomethyl-7-deazaguanine transporter [Francisellaceae bacterium]MBT6206666.1 7-cyano-7-deazaguanine/7-aminomethyl-7-deazaguanine transporter [Francisellaceae bacterium]MBT6539282.1 7-cyano-7-deazaguanine/7-aminomethyl-7-deazaguanine transporter [Francisellaceae bacterium]
MNKNIYLYLALVHILLITISNTLVQYPFTMFGFHTTLGAFSYPLIFIVTDLTTRLLGQQVARNVIFKSMFPALIISYIFSVLTEHKNIDALLQVHVLPLRIASACFIAYLFGQLLDIHVFQKLRTHASWWLAPFTASIIGNIVDTYIFFSIAFEQCSDPFLSENWPEIATVDLCFKLIISTCIFIPAYGRLLNIFSSKYDTRMIVTRYTN